MEEHPGEPPQDAPTPSGGIVIPIEDVPAMNDTVLYALDQLEPGQPLHLIATTPQDDPIEATVARNLLARAEGWARDAQIDPEDIHIERTTLPLPPHEPTAYADAIANYANQHNADHVLLAPSASLTDQDILLASLTQALKAHGIRAEVAPERREQHHRELRVPGTRISFLLLYTATFLFYIIVSEFGGAFALFTGLLVAGIVTFIFHRVTFTRSPPLPESIVTFARWILYAPYLLYQIIKANLQVAYLILHPNLPIDPRLDRYRSSLETDIARTTLANSITLTPGTLSVEVRGNIFYIHSLVPDAEARDLAIAVTYVFQGREGLERADPWEPLATDEVIVA